MTGGGGRAALYIALSAVALLWPALLNLYPLVFGDTGVYLRDGVTLHVSWPRPFFYGLAIVPLHLKLTAWPIVVAQAAASAALIRLTLTTFLPGAGEGFRYLVMAVLAIGTSLPWFASQVMPDVFGPLVLLALAPAVLLPERFARWQQVALVLVAAAFTTFHQSYVPITGAVLPVLLAWRWWRTRRLGVADLIRAAAAPALAVGLVVAANAVFQGKVSFSPYGKIFLLARSIVEGPGQRTLERECPRPGWTLCAQIGQFPDNVEDFQFGPEGSISRAGGHVVVGEQAGPILADTFKAERDAMIAAAVRRSLQQFVRFATGDWLLRPKQDVAEAWAQVFPPAEVARFAAAKQQRFVPLVADWLQAVHQTLGFASLAVLAAGAAIKLRRRSALGALLAAFVVALVVNAVVSGGLSGVYDRYQSRFVWLAVLGSLMAAASWWRPRSSRDAACGPAAGPATAPRAAATAR